jgi:hypothetical protein
MSTVVFWVMIPCSLVGAYHGSKRLTAYVFRVEVTLKMEALRCSEIMVTTYQPTRPHNLEDYNIVG